MMNDHVHVYSKRSLHALHLLSMTQFIVGYYVSLQALRTIQTDYEKRLKDVETQKEQLLDEMEARETTLINKVIKC